LNKSLQSASSREWLPGIKEMADKVNPGRVINTKKYLKSPENSCIFKT